MTQSCPVLTPSERQFVDIIHRADHALMATVYKALQDATDQAAAELQTIGNEERPPAYEYFTAVVHQKLFLRLCGANPETFEGGDLEIATRILDNDRKMATHYWAGGNGNPGQSTK
jgi:hypothetical protein